MAQIKIKQVRSRIKRLQKQKSTLDSLGLKRIGSESCMKQHQAYWAW